MSLEHAKELKMPFYSYRCDDIHGYTVEVDSPYINNLIMDLRFRVINEHEILDSKVIKAMKNKAAVLRKYYLKDAVTVGFLINDTNKFKRSRVELFGYRNYPTTYLSEKLYSRVSNMQQRELLSRRYFEVSNVDRSFYNRAVNRLAKAVSDGTL